MLNVAYTVLNCKWTYSHMAFCRLSLLSLSLREPKTIQSVFRPVKNNVFSPSIHLNMQENLARLFFGSHPARLQKDAHLQKASANSLRTYIVYIWQYLLINLSGTLGIVLSMATRIVDTITATLSPLSRQGIYNMDLCTLHIPFIHLIKRRFV